MRSGSIWEVQKSRDLNILFLHTKKGRVPGIDFFFAREGKWDAEPNALAVISAITKRYLEGFVQNGEEELALGTPILQPTTTINLRR